jgi:hypothetical protein
VLFRRTIHLSISSEQWAEVRDGPADPNADLSLITAHTLPTAWQDKRPQNQIDCHAIAAFIAGCFRLSRRRYLVLTNYLAFLRLPWAQEAPLSEVLRAILERRENPTNYQRTLRPLYRLNFSSQVMTGISSDKAWAMIWRSKGSACRSGRSKRENA